MSENQRETYISIGSFIAKSIEQLIMLNPRSFVNNVQNVLQLYIKLLHCMKRTKDGSRHNKYALTLHTTTIDM